MVRSRDFKVWNPGEKQVLVRMISREHKERIMRTRVYVMAVFLAVLLSTALRAGDFKVYPGAVKDAKLTQEALQMSANAPGGNLYDVVIYTTTDPFEKVCAFYAKLGQEYNMPSAPKSMKLPSGTELKTTYYLFGGAKDLPSAKSWIKVQNPLISHRKVQIISPGMKKDAAGEVPGVTTIMHMIKK